MAAEQTTAKPVPRIAAPKSTETVLEDQDGIREIVKESVRRNGYKVLIAVGANEALQMAGSYADPIHVLITDLVMPNVGGRELAQRLTPLRPQMKVLFTSGYSEHAADSDDLDPSTMVLQKPFFSRCFGAQRPPRAGCTGIVDPDVAD